MHLTTFPALLTPQKPVQSISEQDLGLLIKKGATTTKKYNGNRVHVVVTFDGKVKFFSRNGKQDWTDCLPQLSESVKSLGLAPNTVLDGELYVPDNENVEAVQAIINSGNPVLGAQREALLKPAIAVFDIIYYKGESVYSKPYNYRRQLISTISSDQFHNAQEVVIKDFDHAMNLIEDSAWEGMVVYDVHAPAKVSFNGRNPRGACWKLKIRHTEDLRAISYTVSKDPSLGVGSLNVEAFRANKWVPVGKIGSFAVTFDRVAALNATYPIMVEVSHYGTNDAGLLEFAKVVRRREDLEN